MRTVFVAVGFSLLIATPAAPQTAAAGTASVSQSGKATPDPNRMVCRRVETIGSRLESKRVCRTAAEWETQRALDRQQLDQSQTQRYPGNSGG